VWRAVPLICVVVLIPALVFLPAGLEFGTGDGGEMTSGFSLRRYGGVVGGYLTTLAGGSLGRNKYGGLVAPLIARGLWASCKLLAVSGLLALGGGVLLALAGLRRRRDAAAARGPGAGSVVREWFRLAPLGLLAAPEVLSGVCLQYLLLACIWAGWHPPLGVGGGSTLRYIVLPALSLAIVPAGQIARVVGVSLEQLSGENHARTHRAIGAGEQQVLRRLAKNAALPLLDSLPSLLTLMLSGLLVAEYLFFYRGLGFWFMHAMRDHDLVTVAGCCYALAAVYLVVNWAVDLFRWAVAPQLRRAATEEGGREG